MDKRGQGIYEKFTVKRTDGTDAPGGKHENCRHFVLDLNHDPHAIPALRAYADSAEKDGYVPLAAELRFIADGAETALASVNRPRKTVTLDIPEMFRADYGASEVTLTLYHEYGMWAGRLAGEAVCAPELANGDDPSPDEIGQIEDWHGITDAHRKEIEAL